MGKGKIFVKGISNFKTEKLKSLLPITSVPFSFTLICFFRYF